MVDRSSLVIAVFNGERGGTKNAGLRKAAGRPMYRNSRKSSWLKIGQDVLYLSVGDEE